MFRPLASSVAAGLIAAAAASAQTTSVDLRIVEQTGQTQVLYSNGASPDAVLNFAVQVRVNGGGVLGGVGFDAIILGEPDTNGTLGLNMISNVDHTYSGLPPVPNASVGRGGLASTFTFLAALDIAFNGKINMSSGQFTHNPANSEIGLITGAALGAALFATPGLDPNQEGNPATWSGYGTGNSPIVGMTAPVDPTIAATYLARGQYIDVYRFRYTVTNFSNRTLTLTLQNLRLQTASQFVYSNSNGWGLDNATWGGAAGLTGLAIPIVQAPQGTCCDVAMGSCTVGAQFACIAPAVWMSGGACDPNPCGGQQGACCAPSGVCTQALQANCPMGSAWTAGGVCDPSPCPQPGTCCDLSGACAIVLQSACTGTSAWSAGTVCDPNPCPQPGTCCELSGACAILLQSACTGTSVWSVGTACDPNPCPQPGTCCDLSGACAIVLQSACIGTSVWSVGTACDPNPCPQPGTCCDLGGACAIVLQSACTGTSAWSAGTACNPNPCPQPGTCCDAGGACTLVLESACASGSVWTVGGACDPNPCPQPGTCCDAGGACTLVLESACASGSVWTMGGACDPSPCPMPGACCRGSICQLALAADCTGPNSQFTTSGQACNASGHLTVPCCLADFNRDGIAVQDIFDFLNAWFAGDPRADFNGGGLSVEDIFDFLNGWLAGCS